MSNSSSTFPASQRDILNLKQIASDAAADLSSAANAQTSKAKSQIHDLASRFQEVGSERFRQINGNLTDLTDSARTFAAERPLTCIGAAFAGGFLLALFLLRERD